MKIEIHHRFLNTYLGICIEKWVKFMQKQMFYHFWWNANIFFQYVKYSLCMTLYEGIISALRECNIEMSFRHAMGFVLLLSMSRELDLHARKDRATYILSARTCLLYAATTDAIACMPPLWPESGFFWWKKKKKNNGDFEYF